MRDILKISGVGVMTAERIAINKMAYLRFRVRREARITLMEARRARTRGSSKVNPNPKIKAVQKETNLPAEIMGWIFSD